MGSDQLTGIRVVPEKGVTVATVTDADGADHPPIPPSKDKASVERIGGLPIMMAGEENPWIKMVVYGDPGVGKTRLVASSWEVEAMRPILFLDIEGGIESFQYRYPEIKVIRIRDTYNTVGRLVKTAWENFSGVYEEMKGGKYEFNTIIIDSLTEAYDLAKRHWLHNVIAVQGKDDRDPDMPAKRDWVKQGALMRRMFRLFRDLDKHVLYTALKADVTTDDGALVNHTPSLPGKLAYEISGFVGELLYMDVVAPSKKEATEGNKGVRRLLTQPINKYLAKDRSDNLPLLIENPTMATLAQMMLGKKGGQG